MKKFLSIALALVMVLSMAAFSASAENYEEKTVETNWQLGYVGSSSNTAGFVNVLNPNGGSYSYSDVIDMGPAGSTISFADDASAYASAAAYVFSFWKKNGAEYELDLEANNIPGYSVAASRSYEFVTTEDNQAIRVTYRSEQKADMTPVFEEIFIDGVKVDTNWNFGYVKADGSIVASGSAYSYTDVIVVPKAGSKVTFTDTNKNGTAFCSNSAYVFSTWTKDGENWIFASGVKGEEGTFTNTPVVYSYTSTKDNELVRLCYRSEEKANAPIDPALRPVVILKTPVAEAPVEPPVEPENPTTGDATLNIVAAVLASLALAVTVIKKRTIA
ncbi:MAG: hypothetical protein J6S14_07780 [Clostridia bacterium]|nr:hypothetical protein [Clostridia bacterium]